MRESLKLDHVYVAPCLWQVILMGVNAEKSCENRSALVRNAGIQLLFWCLECSSDLQGLQGPFCAHLQPCQRYLSLQTTKKSSVILAVVLEWVKAQHKMFVDWTS